MGEPLVSILIPCHNAARCLEQTLASALAQTWRRTEIVVVDDGSTDASLEIANRYRQHGILVRSQAQSGASSARNSALAAASGEFIQFLDADDLLASDKISTQIASLSREGPGVMASGAWARFHVARAEAVFAPETVWRDLTGVEFLQLHFEEGHMMHPAAWLVPRAVLDRAGPWDESLSLNDDGEYFARVVLAARQIIFCQSARSYYRSAVAGSLSGRTDRAALESLFRSVNLMTQHLLERDGSPRSRAAAAHAWKRTSFDLFPGAPDLSEAAEARSHSLGGSERPLALGRRVRWTSRLLGWRRAKTLFG